MKEAFKLLIAYDGSECSEAALRDLRQAGFPPSGEAVVATIAHVFLPPPDDEVAADEIISPAAAAIVRPYQLRATKAVQNALATAKQGEAHVKADFPGWSVKAAAESGTPAWEIIHLAVSLKVDLIVMGSHGHSSAGGRLILGSVSQRVLYEAPCSVRLARCREQPPEGPIRFVIGFSGSVDSELAVNAAAARSWPSGSEARLVSIGETADASVGAAEKRLQAAGLITSEISRPGDPAAVLIEEAEKWHAHSIFVGTRNVHGFQHLLHGSVSSAVAAGAQCTVEVVRTTVNMS